MRRAGLIRIAERCVNLEEPPYGKEAMLTGARCRYQPLGHGRPFVGMCLLRPELALGPLQSSLQVGYLFLQPSVIIRQRHGICLWSVTLGSVAWSY